MPAGALFNQPVPIGHTVAVHRMVSALASATGEGDLVGNWSWTVWLLIPVAVVLAVVTARTLGGGDDGEPTPPRGGGVGRYLERTGGTAATRTEEEH